MLSVHLINEIGCPFRQFVKRCLFTVITKTTDESQTSYRRLQTSYRRVTGDYRRVTDGSQAATENYRRVTGDYRRVTDGSQTTTDKSQTIIDEPQIRTTETYFQPRTIVEKLSI